MSEEDFWNSTPSKIISLAEVHIKLNKSSNKPDKNASNSNNVKVTELICLDDE